MGRSLLSEEASISDNLKGFILAAASGVFIGSSFIIKKLGLKRAGASGARAGLFSFLGFFIIFLGGLILWVCGLVLTVL